MARIVAGAPAAAIGQDVVIGVRRLRIVGVLPDRLGRDEPLVMLPLALLVTLTADALEPNALIVQAPDIDAVEPLKGVATRWSTSRYADGVTVAATGLQRLRDVAQFILLFVSARATSRQAGWFAARPQQADASTSGSAFGSSC